MNTILTPIKVGNLTLKNRLMFPPLTTGYEEKDGSMSDRAISFYERLAKGGVGYIVLGDVAPVQTLSPTPKLYCDEQIPSFKKFTDTIHKHGSVVSAQIFHPEYNPQQILELFKAGEMQKAREVMHHDMENYCNEISIERIKEIQQQMIDAAVRADKAGFDMVQIHGDRIVGMFSSPLMNKRDDEYGGSLENRLRFGLELVKGIKKAAPRLAVEYKLALIRMNPRYGKGGPDLEEGPQAAIMLEKAGVDTIHVCQANHTAIADTLPPMGVQPYGCFSHMAAKIKPHVNIPVSAVGRVINPLHAKTIIQTQKADIVAVGRPLLADPDWIKKIESNKENEIRQCIMCNKGCTDRLTGRSTVSCVLNAENGYESQRQIDKAKTKGHIAIIGAGIAGLESARVLLQKGHKVTIFDKSAKIGGQINIASVPPRKDEMNRSIMYYENILVGNENINFVLGKKVDAQDIVKLNPDHVIVAVGANNSTIPVKGANNLNVLDAWQVLKGEQVCSDNVVVIGGGLVGAETAEFLAETKGCKVSIVEMGDVIAKEESPSIRPTMMKNFEEFNVNLLINNNSITCENSENKQVDIDADFVVMAIGAKANKFDTELFDMLKIPYTLVGDCIDKPSDIENAIKTSYDAANRVEVRELEMA